MQSILRHPEMRVVGVVLLSLLVSEAGMRTYGERLSKDVAHLAQFADIAAELAHAPLEGRPLRVLFLGNSLTRCGVISEEFRKVAESTAGQPITVAKMTPDNTAVADWFYAYRNYFAECGQSPDTLVIGFQGGHLNDAPSIHPQRLARFYCDAQDWPDLCRDDLIGIESRTAYVVASQSALLASRDRIERRALDLLIPGYQTAIQTMNERARAVRHGMMTAATYDRLNRLLDLAAADGAQVVLVAMPVPTPYEIDPALRELASKRQVSLLDCREVPGISKDMFPDGLHMNDQAAARYSRYLAGALDWGHPERHVARANGQ